MTEDTPEKQSFWTTLPGILTGLAALVTAVGGLIAIVSSGGDQSAEAVKPDTNVNSPAIETSATKPPPKLPAKPSGTQNSTSGNQSPIINNTTGNVTITTGN